MAWYAAADPALEVMSVQNRQLLSALMFAT